MTRTKRLSTKRKVDYASPKGRLKELIEEMFPNSAPGFIDLTIKEIELHAEKNHDYARGGDAFGNFKRNAAHLAMYPNLKLSDPRVFALVLAMKQIDAVLWSLNVGTPTKVENIGRRLKDIYIYAKIVELIDQQTDG